MHKNIKTKFLSKNMDTKKFRISKELIHGILLTVVIIAIGSLIVWGLGSMGASMEAQLLGL